MRACGAAATACYEYACACAAAAAAVADDAPAGWLARSATPPVRSAAGTAVILLRSGSTPMIALSIVVQLAAAASPRFKLAHSPLLGSTITMQPCTDPANQEFICYVDSKHPTCGGPRNPSPYAGMQQFKAHAGICLAADPVSHLLTTAPCNVTDGYQRFNGFNGLLLQGAHQDKTCVTANCTIHNAHNLTCMPGASLRMEPCINQWPGSPIPGTKDPAQIWDLKTDHVGSGSIVLKYTWVASEHPKHGVQVNSTSCLSMSGSGPNP